MNKLGMIYIIFINSEMNVTLSWKNAVVVTFIVYEK